MKSALTAVAKRARTEPDEDGVSTDNKLEIPTFTLDGVGRRLGPPAISDAMRCDRRRDHVALMRRTSYQSCVNVGRHRA